MVPKLILLFTKAGQSAQPYSIDFEVALTSSVFVPLPFPVSYLSVKMHPAVRRVLRQEVEPQAGQNLVAVLVLPEQLQLSDADDVRVVPDLDKEELAEGQDLDVSALVEVLGGLVEGVGRVVAARRTDEAEKLAVPGLRVHSVQHLGLLLVVVDSGRVHRLVGGRRGHEATLRSGAPHTFGKGGGEGGS